MIHPTVVVIMAKQPQAGHSKTRLCPPLTLAEAAHLSEALLRDSVDLVASIQGIDRAAAITPPDSQAYFENIFTPGTRLLPVAGSDIGQCLQTVLEQLFALGYSKAIAFNSDGPTLPPAYLQQAIQALDENDLVLGPSEDGGYYLIGLKHMHPELFQGIAWSTTKVLAQTCQRVASLRLRWAMTPPWYDVDTAQDLLRLQDELEHLPGLSLPHTRHAVNTFKLLRRKKFISSLRWSKESQETCRKRE